MTSRDDSSQGVRFAHAFFSASTAFVTSFVLQRVLTWKVLGLPTLPTREAVRNALVTGLLADVWSGVALAMLTAIVSLFILARVLRMPARMAFFSTVLFLLIFLSLHIAYVEFFGAMISLRHLTYLFDPSFMGSSWSTLFHSKVLFTLVLTTALFFLSFRFFSSAKSRVATTLVFVVGALCQVTKVQLNTLKIGWKTPQILSVTSIENIVVQLQDTGDLRHDPLSPDEKKLLDKLETDVLPSEGKLAELIKSRVAARIQSQKPVYFIVALLESVRPLESKFFTPTNAISYTPFLDSLAEGGVAFLNAYTAGDVTRSGQEAVVCGLLTGQYTSAMRGLLTLSPTCLAKPLGNIFGEGFFSAWWHAGDFNFDGQGTFWKRAGFDKVTSRNDFDASVPSTYWGASDFALAQTMAKGIASTRASQRVQFHLFLSVTNHSDWSVPTDAPADFINVQQNSTHVSQVTTRYTDEALKNLVTSLKETRCTDCDEEFWKSTVMFVMNDHGNLVPSQMHPNGHAWGLSEEEDLKAAKAASHGALVLSGGIVEDAVSSLDASERQRQTRVEKFVSQVDIFATIADFTGLANIRTVGDSLFAAKRRWPIAVDLGQYLYLPELNFVDKRAHFLKRPDNTSDPSPVIQSRVFFRAYQRLLLSGDAGRSEVQIHNK